MPDETDFDQPEQTYVPRWFARLAIRFEEFGDTAPLRALAPKKPVKNAKGVSDLRVVLSVQQDPTAPPGVNRLVLLPQGQPSTASQSGNPQLSNNEIVNPFEAQKSSDGKTQYIDAIVPREAQWTQNGPLKGDTLHMTFKFIDLPIDPRAVRACGVQFYLGTIPVDQHGAQIRGEAGILGKPPLPETWTDANGVRRTNKRFEGWVDDWSTDFDDQAEPSITFECRDNLQLVIDQEAPPKLVVDAKKPFAPDAIAQYLAHFPQFAGLSVEYRGAESTDVCPTLDSVLAKTAYRPTLGPPPAGGGGAAQGAGKFSVWDYLTDAAGALGHNIRIENSTIVVQRLRALMGGQSARAGDPFRSRGGFDHRVMIFGKNVLKLKIGRKYNKQTPQNVEVRSYLPREKRLIVGRFPSKTDFLAMGLPGDGGTDQKWVVHRYPGLKTEAACIAVAKHIYEMVGRNEMTMKVTTHNLASYGGGNLDPDILDMQTGDAFELLVNRDPTGSTINEVESFLVVQEQAAQFLRDLGFDDTFATAYGKAYSDAGFQTVFRTKTVAYACNIEEGVAVDLDGINYIEVRAGEVFGSDDGKTDAADSANA